MDIILDQIPIPPSENQLYATDWKTGRRFESKESKEYKERFKVWALKRFQAIADLQDVLKWEMADHRRMILVDTYFVLQSSELFTKPVKKNEKSRRKKMDVSNKCKALYDCLGNMLKIDDSRFMPGVVEPIIRLSEVGQYTIMRLRFELIRDEDALLEEIKNLGEIKRY